MRRERVKFLGRHLMVKGKYVKMILEGRKKTTIRLGIVKPKYRDVILHGGGSPVALIRITGVQVKKVKDLTDEDALRDGFRARKELIKALEKAYGKLDENQLVTIIEFHVLKPITREEDELMGLTPIEAARIALRYDDQLGDEERRTLLELTRTNSLRKTAERVYGSIGAKWRIKRILRDSFKRLKERGVLR